MKKIIALMIVAAIAVSAAACSSSTASSSSSQESSSSVSESVSSEESSAESLPEESAPEYVIPEENAALGDIITASRSDELNEAFPLVLSAEDPSAQLIFDLLGLKAEDLSAYAISVSPMNTMAYGVAILKPAEGKNDAVLEAANAWVSNQQKSFEQYLQDQYEIAKAATVDQLADGTVVLVMSENGADVQKGILDALK